MQDEEDDEEEEEGGGVAEQEENEAAAEPIRDTIGEGPKPLVGLIPEDEEYEGNDEPAMPMPQPPPAQGARPANDRQLHYLVVNTLKQA